MNEDDRDDLYGDIERRALHDLPDDEPDDDVDLVAALRADDDATAAHPSAAAAAPDMTLGGYIELHDRVPAFDGSDGMPYTVDIDVEPTHDPERPCAAFLIFIRWAATGAGIMDHVESDDIAFGADADAARQAALELSLYEVKAELDAAIARRRQALEAED